MILSFKVPIISVPTFICSPSLHFSSGKTVFAFLPLIHTCSQRFCQEYSFNSTLLVQGSNHTFLSKATLIITGKYLHNILSISTIWYWTQNFLYCRLNLQLKCVCTISMVCQICFLRPWVFLTFLNNVS